MQPNIGYKVQNENRELAIGTIALLTNANQYLLPYFTFQKKAGEGELIFSVGIKCESLQTNLKNLLAINPFADYANRNLQIGVLQKAYLGFSKDRELDKVELIADSYGYTDVGCLLHL